MLDDVAEALGCVLDDVIGGGAAGLPGIGTTTSAVQDAVVHFIRDTSTTLGQVVRRRHPREEDEGQEEDQTIAHRNPSGCGRELREAFNEFWLLAGRGGGDEPT